MIVGCLMTALLHCDGQQFPAMKTDSTKWRCCVLYVHPRRLLVPLLPLVVHTLHSVRRAVSRVLALILFGNAAQQWSGFAPAAAATAASAAEAAGLDTSAWQQQQQGDQQQPVLLPSGVNGVLLPEPFLRQYKFPFRVLPVSVAAAAAVPDSAQGMHGQSLQEHQQQQDWVKQLVEQQQLLQLAGNNPSAARALLADCLPHAAHHISQRVLSATANQLFNVDAAAVAQRLLSAVQASGSHAECEQALQQLEQLASSYQGLQSIAAAGSTPSLDQPAAAAAAVAVDHSIPDCSWQSAFERLLGAAPINREDQRLWLRLLQLLERMVAAAPLPEVRGCVCCMQCVLYVCCIAGHDAVLLLLRMGSALLSFACVCMSLHPCVLLSGIQPAVLHHTRLGLDNLHYPAMYAQVQCTHLQLLLQQSVSTWLQQPASSRAVPRPPLALAMGTNSWELLKQQPSSAAAAAAVADMLGLNSANSKDAAAVGAAAAGPEADGDRILALQVSRQALRVLLQLVKAVKRSSCHVRVWSNAGQTCGADLAALQPAELLQLLCSSLLARGEEADYCCRVLAAALLHEVTGALQDSAQIARLQNARGSSSSISKGSSLQLAAECEASRQPGGCGLGLSDEAAAALDAIEPLITKVLMPVAGRAVPGFKGKALVKTALEVLLAVVRGPVAAQEEWSQVWAAIGGTFWLSRWACSCRM
jgi:hypothetical protein